jgi:hypothetical protein
MTSVFTGDETGVMNAAEAAKATIMANGAGEASTRWAIFRARHYTSLLVKPRKCPNLT